MNLVYVYIFSHQTYSDLNVKIPATSLQSDIIIIQGRDMSKDMIRPTYTYFYSSTTYMIFKKKMVKTDIWNLNI